MPIVQKCGKSFKDDEFYLCIEYKNEDIYQEATEIKDNSKNIINEGVY